MYFQFTKQLLGRICKVMILLPLISIVMLMAGCTQTELDSGDSSSAALALSSLMNESKLEGRSHRKEPIRPISPPEDLSKNKIALGHSLFNDVRLSGDNSVSCATCHDVKNGGDDGRKTSLGSGSQIGGLNSPTVLNSSLSIAQFWDGRVATLAEQVPEPIHNPIEMNSNWVDVIAKLKLDRAFVARFNETFRQGITKESIVEAIVSYEEALITVDSPFDQYLRGDDSAISADAHAGYELFKSIGCISCHQGQAVGGNMFQEFGIMGDYFAQFDETSQVDDGRINFTKRDVDLHRFKVPSLRNVEETAPYFHNGSAKTLDEAIRIMAEYQLGESVTDENVKQIKAFLNSLTGVVSKELQ